MMMKRAVSFVLFGLGTVALFGCPIYPAERDQGECFDYDCRASTYDCNTGLDCPSGYVCTSNRCQLPNTRGNGAACTKPSDCSSGNCGADNKCHAGDCSTTGCPSSFVCRLGSGTNGVPACVAIGSTDGGTGISSSCQNDGDCSSPTGSKCLSGTCVPPQDQCVDATQCPGDAQCVQGSCTPSCNANKPCPTGYACDTGKGVCTNNPTPCTSSAQCSGGTTCVQEHCVVPCGAGGTCAVGLLCVDGGCTPDEKPVFTCTTDGQQENCQAGSICLRHSCYIGCNADAGAEACKSADKFNQCKSVTTSSGTYDVCGSTSNLGTECDPTQSKNCAAPLVCIDGFCK